MISVYNKVSVEQLLKLTKIFCKLANMGMKRFWGVKASGVLFVCKEDNTIFLAKRSSKVEHGGTWGIPGGAVDIYLDELEEASEKYLGYSNHFYYPDSDKSKYPDPSDAVFAESAMRETQEECGTIPNIESLLQTITFTDKEFTYKTFVYNISKQSKKEFMKSIQTNWETSKFKWFPNHKLPANIHHGVKYTLSQLKI